MSGKIAQNPNRQSGTIGSIPSATKDSGDPAANTNPSSGLGAEWINTTSGEIYICTNALTDSNTWIGQQGSFVSGGRGLFGGGSDAGGSAIDSIEYVEISTLGGGTDFGDLSTALAQVTGTSNSINGRGLFGGGEVGAGQSNVIEYITISTPGDVTDFGDLTAARTSPAGLSNGANERGIFAGGDESGGPTNVIDYVTISTTGNATDFGNDTGTNRFVGGTSNDTNERGIIVGGKDENNNWTSAIRYITISTTGNATSFGTLSQSAGYVAANSNGTNERGVFAGLYGGSFTNIIEYITISTTGNTTDFGDLTLARSAPHGSSNGPSERAIFGGGYATSAATNTIDYITINSTGNATDFGDLITARNNHASLSDVQG